VVNVYWGAVKNGALTPEKFKQDLAHELFHCVQYAQLDMYVGRTGVTAWWAEGSADWASGIVYPGVNGEQEWSPYYQQNKSLPDQCDPSWSSTCGGIYAVYATSLFFQDMANQKGNGAVFDLLKHVAVRSRSPQMRAIAETPDMDRVFEKFAQDFIDKKISDPGGGYMAQPVVKITDFLQVDDTKDVTVQGQPLMIYVYKINFAKGKTYALTGLANQDRFRLSYHMADDPWISGEGSAPITIEAGCAAKTMTVAVSSAKDSPDVQDFTLHANVTDAEPICEACQCARPVPACVIGHWVGDEAPQPDYFVQNLMNVQKAGKNKAVFEGGKVIVDNANLALNIQTGGRFNGSTDIAYHGSGKMQGQKITMSGGIKSTSHGTSCITQEGQLCLNHESVSPPVAMKITAMGMTIPFASKGGTYKGVVSMPFTCSPHSLILKPTVKGGAGIPTREMPMKFHR
jgi:hypothetical protein